MLAEASRNLTKIPTQIYMTNLLLMTKHLLSEPISFSLENLNSENGSVLLMKVAIMCMLPQILLM